MLLWCHAGAAARVHVHRKLRHRRLEHQCVRHYTDVRADTNQLEGLQLAQLVRRLHIRNELETAEARLIIYLEILLHADCLQLRYQRPALRAADTVWHRKHPALLRLHVIRLVRIPRHQDLPIERLHLLDEPRQHRLCLLRAQTPRHEIILYIDHNQFLPALHSFILPEIHFLSHP